MTPELAPDRDLASSPTPLGQSYLILARAYVPPSTYHPTVLSFTMMAEYLQLDSSDTSGPARAHYAFET